jgi:hypothetical protein
METAADVDGPSLGVHTRTGAVAAMLDERKESM